MEEEAAAGAATDLPPTKAALDRRVAQAWSSLEEVLGRLDERQLVAPGPEGWSVKDHLAHVTTWEQSLPALLEGRDRVAAIGLDPAEHADDWDIDAVNALLQRRHRDTPLPEVLAAFQNSGRAGGGAPPPPYRLHVHAGGNRGIVAALDLHPGRS